MKATVVIVPYQNDIKFLNILDRILEAEGEFNVLVVDNNPKNKLSDIIRDYPVKYMFNKNKGMLAGAMNLAIGMIDTEYLIYICSNHTHITDNSWLIDMVDAMDKQKADMGGTISPVTRGHNHVQGGVFIARTDKLRETPYNEKKFPFQFMDVYISDKFAEKGYKMIDIHIVHSVMGKPRIRKEQKIIHTHNFPKIKFA